MSVAFVLGNGLSRQGIDLANLKKYGRIYGCNALYRDFSPDVLVSTDPGISLEIQKSGWPLKNKHYTRKPYNSSTSGFGSMALPVETATMSSGPNALNLAIMAGFKHIYLLGFDFGSVGEKFNNVYANTDHYKMSDEEPTYAGNWIYNMSRMVKINKWVQFSRVVNQHSKKNIMSYSNYQEFTIDQFKNDHK